MFYLKNIFLLLLLSGITEVVSGQQVRFRHVMGNIGYDIGMSAQQVADKGYIVCGSTTSVGNGNTDIYVIKTDSLGKPQNEVSLGGLNVDRGTSIRQTNDNGYIVLGYSNDLSGIGGYDICAIKLDSVLHVEWKKTYGGSDWDFGNCIRQTSDGGYIICGGTYSYGNGDEDYFLIKTNEIGDTLWTRTYGGLFQDEAKSVVETADGGYVVTGFSMSNDTLGDFYTIKTNNTGDTLWTHTFGGTKMDLANDIIELQTGGYAVAGETQSMGAGKSDGIILEITPDGKSGRTFLGGEKEDDRFISLTQRKDGMIAFAGITFNFGFGNGDIYFGILGSDFSYNFSTTFGSNGRELVNSVACTADDGFIICGTTNGFRNLLDDIYLVKTGSDGFANTAEVIIVTTIDETTKPSANFTIHPNPCDATVTLRLSAIQHSAVTITINDLIGRTLLQKTVRSAMQENILLQLDALSNGPYIITVSTNETTFSQPIIVKHD